MISFTFSSNIINPTYNPYLRLLFHAVFSYIGINSL